MSYQQAAPDKCAHVRCARAPDPECKPGERLVANDGGCCAPPHVCVTDERKTLYSSCGILPFLPKAMGGSTVATPEDVRAAL